ncbi:uncharacterized protein LOC110249682 [Exaiptasia diaphana]|uniref:Transposase n=1 Tax=Exaiptasia diaphana TaxID=2652724 RepID=A0A913XYV3_EXADI|nr:uncharacterized protein LOC110249682 [Exaiptasia diaphana]
MVEELSIERRTRWLAAITRDKLTEAILRNDRVCSRHFVSGRPAASWHKFNIDWVPTLNLGHSKKAASDEDRQRRDIERAERAKVRRKRQHEEELKVTAAKLAKLDEPGELVKECFSEEQNYEQSAPYDAENVEESATTDAMTQNDIDTVLNELESLLIDSSTQTEFPNKSESCESSTQTEEFDYMFKQCSCKPPFDAEDMEDDNKVRFYTGLAEAKTLQILFEYVSPYVQRKSQTLTKFQEMVMVLIKLRLNVPFQDLAFRFGVSASTVSRTFSTWIGIMDSRLKRLIYWSERQELWNTMPKCFHYSFGNRTTVIIDCFEVFIERPTNLLARAQTFSSYKHHNTIKVLIGITPQGTISFLSNAWGGRTSDKFLTENCGILEKLVPGDMVMADRGFTIQESVSLKRAELVIPAFTKGKTQLDPMDVERTRGIANVRIHVERVIGLLRSKYTILQGTLTTDFLITNSKSTKPLIDKILRVSAALVNLCPSIIPFD